MSAFPQWLLLPIVWLARVCSSSPKRAFLVCLGALLCLCLPQAKAQNHPPTVNVEDAPLSFATGPNVPRTIKVVCYDDDGFANINDVWLLINTRNTWLRSISVFYNRPENKFYLRNDDGTAWDGGFTPGSSNTISNSQGTVSCGAAAQVLGNQLSITFTVTPKSALDGPNAVRAYCNDLAGAGTTNPYPSYGTWTISGSAPSVTVPSPALALNSGVGRSRIVSVNYSDPDSAGSIKEARLMIGPNQTGTNAIYAYYDGYNNLIYLRDNTNSSWSVGSAAGSGTALSNSQGTIDCTGTVVTRAGNNLTVDWKITPASTLTGSNTLTAYAIDRGDRTSGAAPGSTIGTWQVAASAMTITGSTAQGQATLNWSTVSGATGYHVLRSTTPGKNYTQITTTALGAGVTSYNNTGLSASTTYYYLVYPLFSTGRGPDSNELALLTPAPPTPTPTVGPTSTPTAVPTSTPTAVPTSTPTSVPTSTPTVAPTATPTVVPTAIPTAVPTSTPTAVPTSTPTAVPTSTPTAIPTATPVPLGKVANLDATFGMDGGSNNVWANLKWSPVPGATSYIIKRAPENGGMFTTLDANWPNTTYMATGLTNFTFYQFSISAKNAQGQVGPESTFLLWINASIDVKIRSASNSWWIGDGIINHTAQDQDAQQQASPNKTATYFISTRRYNTAVGNSRAVAFTVPNVNAFLQAGGQVEFYQDTDGDLQTEELSERITPDIISPQGWRIDLAPNQNIVIRMKVKVPSNAQEATSNTLFIQCHDVVIGDLYLRDCVSATTIVGPPPSIDASVRTIGFVPWMGKGIYDTNPELQKASKTIEATTAPTADYWVSAYRNNGNAASTVRLKVTNWDAFQLAGGSATFYNNGSDITNQITGSTGWPTTIAVGEESLVQVKIAVPASVDPEVLRNIDILATDENGTQDPPADAVRASLTIKPFAGKPDAQIRLSENSIRTFIGENVYLLDGSQFATGLAVPDQYLAFDIRVKNKTQGSRTFKVKLPATPTGWGMILRDAGGAIITMPAQTAAGWETPLLSFEESVDLRLELKPLSISAGDADVSVRVENTSGSSADLVRAVAATQFVQGIEFTLDPGPNGKGAEGTWQVVTGGIVVPQDSVVCLRAIRGNQNAPWPNDPFLPKWTRGQDTFVGDHVWLLFPDATEAAAEGETINVNCGNTFSMTVRVLPAPADN